MSSPTSTPDQAIKLRVVRGTSGIECLTSQWNKLAERQETTTLLQFPQYYAAYAETLLNDSDQFILVAIFRGHDLVGLFPFEQHIRWRRLLALKVLALPDTPCPLRDVLIDPREDVRELITYLREALASEIKWDLINLKGVPESSAAVFAEASCAFYRRREIGYNNYQDVAISMPPLSGRLTRNLRKRKRKLERLGTIDFVTLSSLQDLQIAFQTFVNLEGSGWKGRSGGNAIKLRDDHMQFYRNLMERFATKEGCQIHILNVDGKAIAANFCLRANNTWYCLKSGYDESYAQVSPGKLLREYVLSYYYNDPLIEFFDLISAYDWQREWNPGQRRTYEINIYNLTTNGLAHWLLTRLRSKLKIVTKKRRASVV